MSQSRDDESAFKLAQLYNAFDRKLDVKFIENILQTKGDINYTVPKNNESAGYTALHFAKVKRQDLEVFRLLLRHGADFNIKNDSGKTVLHEILGTICLKDDWYNVIWGLASKLSNETLYFFLDAHLEMSKSENPGDKYGLTHFHIACMADHPAAVEMFLNSGVPVDIAINEDSPFFPGCTPLDVAVRSCALEVVKVLLKYFDDPLVKDKAVMKAIDWLIGISIGIVDLFINEVRAISPEEWLSKFKFNQEIIHFLYDSKICTSISEIGLSNLHIACIIGNILMVEDVLDHVVRIDLQVNTDLPLYPGYTALHFAAYVGLEIVHLLLAKGANILIENTDGITPFDICIERYGVKHIHSIMLTQSIWKGITLLDGRTQLIDLVSAMQDIDLFGSFLDEHIDNINMSVSKDSPLWPGYTPLHLAVLFTEQTKNRSNYSREGKFVPNLELIEECLNRGADVTAKDLFGTTPLQVAFYRQKTDTIAKLLQVHHNCLNPVDKNNVGHLHIACASVDINIVEKLLQSGANVNLPVLSNIKIYRTHFYSNYPVVKFIPVGSTPLHIAVATGNHKIAKQLVDSGADVNAADENGVTPIHRLLVEDSGRNTAKILLSANLQEVVVSDAGISHLHVASYFGDVDAVKRLLDLGAEVEAPLGCQLALGDLCDNYTIKNWATIHRLNYAEGTAWHIAAWQGSEEVAKLLTSRVPHFLTKTDLWRIRIDKVINSQFLVENDVLAKQMEEVHGLTALHLACYEASLATIEKLLDKGMDVNAQFKAKDWEWLGYTPLHMLIAGYDISTRAGDEDFTDDMFEITRMLLGAGADVNLTDEEGKTPLHLLILNECFSNGERFYAGMLNMMLNSIQNFHVNPVPTLSVLRMSHFHIACLQNNVTVIRKFLEHGVDVNAVIDLFSFQNQGSSALHLIVDEYNGDLLPPEIEAINALLEYGADANAQNVDGDTILHEIARLASDRVDILARLMSAGADINKLNIVCETPFTELLFSKNATSEGIKLFIKYGCRVNDFNVVDQRGCLSRPLFASRSVMEDRAKIFEALFQSPGLTESDATGRTAIHNIVSAAAFKLFRRSIHFDFDLKNVAVDEYGRLISMLCKKGCDIDSRDQLGRTPLHLAASFKNKKAVAALLMNGADVNITDLGGITAFNYSFNSCECQLFESLHRHNDLITTFYIHMRKLIYLNLNINAINRGLAAKANSELDLTAIRMSSFYKEINQVNAMTFEEDSATFNFKHLLSETGIVAVYPFKESLKLLLDKFFQNVDDYLENYKEVIGLFKLQMRKAKNRTKLIQLAAESLNKVVGFLFPEICSQRILRFLSNSDFENLIFITYHAELSRIIPEVKLKLLSEIAVLYQQNLWAKI